jgi:tRNA A58 N-methylase Trm61
MKSKDLIAKQERTEFLFDSYRERAREQAAKLLSEAIENYGQLFTDDDEDACPSTTLYMTTSSDVDEMLVSIVTTGHYRDMAVEALEDDDNSDEYSVDLDDPDEVIEHLLELISPEKAIQIIAQTLVVED